MVRRPPTIFDVPLCVPVRTIACTPDGAPRMDAAARVEISWVGIPIVSRRGLRTDGATGSAPTFVGGPDAPCSTTEAVSSSLGSVTVRSGSAGRGLQRTASREVSGPARSTWVVPPPRVTRLSTNRATFPCVEVDPEAVVAVGELRLVRRRPGAPGRARRSSGRPARGRRPAPRTGSRACVTWSAAGPEHEPQVLIARRFRGEIGTPAALRRREPGWGAAFAAGGRRSRERAPRALACRSPSLSTEGPHAHDEAPHDFLGELELRHPALAVGDGRGDLVVVDLRLPVLAARDPAP